MYTIHANGELLFDSLSEDVESIALSPKLALDINSAGSVSFVLPPGNRLHGRLKKLKSIVTVEQDGVQLARSRVMETESDYYNQQTVYCEGDRAFLLDSVHPPYHYTGTVHGLFRQLIENHNSMVDGEKQFVIGTVTAVGADVTTEVKTEAYSNTSSEVEDRLLNAYGGYLRTRAVGNIHYIDWVKQYGNENAQPIEFSVNLLDLTDKLDAGGVFTTLIPLGASEIGDDGEYTDPVSIASVNGGLNYIQDDEAVAKYGKIWRTYTWSYEDDPAKLLEKAREYLKTGIAIETLTLKAVDMHFVDGNVQPIRIGDRVRIRSNPHGLDRVMVCSQIEIDLLNPENTLYTFGEKPRTLTENFVRAEEEVDQLTGYGGGGGGRKSVQEEIGDIIRWAQINVDETNAYIQLTAGELDKTKQQLSAAEIEIDGVQAEISIAAGRIDDVEKRTTSAEIAVSGAEAKITLYASSVETLEDHMTQAQIDIDGLNSEISLKADKIDLEGYVTIDSMEAEIADINKFFTGSAQAQKLDANTLTCQTAQITNVSLINYDCNWSTVSMGSVASARLLGTKGGGTTLDLQHSHKVTVNETTGEVQLGEVSETGGNFNIADTQFFKDAVAAANGSEVTLEKLGWAGTSNTVRASNGKSVAVYLPTLTLDEGDWTKVSINADGAYTFKKNVTLKMTDDNEDTTSLESITVDATYAVSDAYTLGYGHGNQSGYTTGYDEGWADGYDSGYKDGESEGGGGDHSVSISGTPSWTGPDSGGKVTCTVNVRVVVDGSVYTKSLSYNKFV